MSASETVARAPSGPRFDLRFERGQARLRLGQPVVGEGFRLEHLVSVVDVRGPTDVSAGAKRFRHHRARLVEARLRIDPRHVTTRVDAGRRVRLAGDPGGLRLSLRDEIGVIELLGALRVDGADVVLHPTALAWIRGAPRGAAERLARLMTPFGVRVERDRLRVVRPLRALLAELLLPSGWRVPDERACEVTIGCEGGSWWIEAFASGTSRESRSARPSPRGEFDGEQVLSAVEPAGPAGRFRAAVDAGDLEGARAALEALGAGWLGAEGALELAERFEHALTPDELAEALLVGLSSIPHDEASWRRWITRLGDRGAVAALRLADVALSSPMPRPTRAALAVAAANGVLDAFGDLSERDEAGVDERLRRVVSEAAALAPERPDVAA
ncbi:MAG: hypothetical protein KF901_34440, partial [Myxococcales bacterium]|nr:hypothetical protein [Myxococcales bacterium]